MWTSFVTGGLYSLQNGLNSLTLINYSDQLVERVDIMINLVRKPLKLLQRSTLSALITQNLHNRDITLSLVKQNISSLSDFLWVKQMKYYWDLNKEDILVKQGHASFSYGYEYVGNSKRLVITPLTELCYLTLTNALAAKQGGLLSGLSGSGKTETVKDLAKAVGMHCVVFNCSRESDSKLMGRLFEGLVQQGSWTCLDNFNRLAMDVLSVVAQYVLAIQQAMIQKAVQFDFNGNILRLNHRFGVFATICPSPSFGQFLIFFDFIELY